MAKFRTLDDIDFRGKRVLLRADLNVPMKDGVVTDMTRIERLAPTIEALIGKGAKVIVMSHFGRPEGKRDPAFSLRPLIEPLSRAIGGRDIVFAEDCIGDQAKRVVAALRPGQVALLENLRFHKEEEANSPDFARALAELGDVYVDDAFSAAHRAHASIDALARLLPNAAGKLMQAELTALTAALDTPRRPVLALIGGAKVSTKLGLLRFLIGKVDILVIAGAMANTFLFAGGREIGRSLCERDLADSARQTLDLAHQRNCRVVLPEDVVTAAALAPGVATRTVRIEAVRSGEMILDIGPDTVACIDELLEEARTVVWNGPLGAFETPPFDGGTVAVAKKIGELTHAGKLLSVAGGGDTVAALDAAGVTDQLFYVSTAGGAFLEWLEGRELPGVAALPQLIQINELGVPLGNAWPRKKENEGLNLSRPLHPDCEFFLRESMTDMKLTKSAVTAALVSSIAVGAAPAYAEPNNPWVEVEGFSAMAGVGAQSGDGQLHLPNLGTNCAYPFNVTGFGAGIKAGVSKVWATGPVNNLTQLEQFPGQYTSTQGEITLIGGGGSGTLKNNANNVSLDLTAKTAGIGIGVSGNSMTIDMPIPPENAPRVYVVEFAFQRNYVNAESRKTLNDLVDAWKCRFVNIAVVGHADTKEYDETGVSQLRADAVRNYLVGAGVVPDRVTAKISTKLQVPTGEAVRLRDNRVAVVTIQ